VQKSQKPWETENAFTALQRAYRLDVNNSRVALAIGNAYSDIHDYKKALTWYQKSIQLRPSAICYRNMVTVLSKLKRYREAIYFSDLALHLNPRSGRSHYQRGELLDLLGRSWQARRFYERAKQLGYEN
jgi:tetratricopeptide (TPR) repeat protein